MIAKSNLFYCAVSFMAGSADFMCFQVVPPTRFDDFSHLFYNPTSFSTPTTHFLPPQARLTLGFSRSHPPSKDKSMPETTIYTFQSPVLNQPVLGLLETGRNIRTSKIVMLEESQVADTLRGPGSGYFITTKSGSRYNLIVLPVSAFQAWLADFLGAPKKEVTTA
jgi:hypothetical protein